MLSGPCSTLAMEVVCQHSDQEGTHRRDYVNLNGSRVLWQVMSCHVDELWPSRNMIYHWSDVCSFQRWSVATLSREVFVDVGWRLDPGWFFSWVSREFSTCFNIFQRISVTGGILEWQTSGFSTQDAAARRSAPRCPMNPILTGAFGRHGRCRGIVDGMGRRGEEVMGSGKICGSIRRMSNCLNDFKSMFRCITSCWRRVSDVRVI